MRERGRFNLDVPDPEYVGTEAEANELLRLCMRKVEVDYGDPFGFDTETYAMKIEVPGGKSKPLDWMRDTVMFWSLSAKFDEQYRRFCIPGTLLWKFIPFLECPDALLVVWNLKYDAHVCWNSSVDIWNSGLRLPSKGPIDVEAMGYLVDENLQGSMSLKERCAHGLIEGSLKAYLDFWATEQKLRQKDHVFERLLFTDAHDDEYAAYFDAVMRNEDPDGAIPPPWRTLEMTTFKALFGDRDPETGKKLKEYETDLRTLPLDKVADYASLDAYAHLKQFEHGQALLERIMCGHRTMWNYFLEMEAGITKVLWRMERRGYLVDVEYLKTLIPPIEKEMLEIEKEINKQAGRPINLSSSSPQLGQYFFAPKSEGGLGLKPIKMTKGGERAPKPSLDEEVLNKFAAAGVPIAKKVKRHRSLAKTKSTYIQALIFLSSWHRDGRIHSNFNQFGARTGRFSSTTPNSMNLPRPDGDEWGIRQAFIADPSAAKKALTELTVEIGKKLEAEAKTNGKSRAVRLQLRSATKKVTKEIAKLEAGAEPPKKGRRYRLIVADYEQLEMRIMAHFCQDPAMLAAIRAGKDMHCETVARMFPGVEYDEVVAAKKYKGKYDDAVQKAKEQGVPCEMEPPTDRQRQLVRWRQEAKTVGFALIYGAGASNIAEQLGITKEEAQKKIDLYFKAYPGVKRFMDDTIDWCYEHGFVTTLIGRVRRLPMIWNPQFINRSHAEREAINAPIQGSAADLIKAAMLNIENDPYLNELEVLIVNQIHDELVMECPEENCALAEPWIREFMEHPFEPGTPDKPGTDPLDVPTPVNVKVVDNWSEAK
jgi:DNA polymerase I-like protein with 3'-5' exonuclease and polymerase domains